MLTSSNDTIRYCAMFTIGMAYCGTSNDTAAAKLLHYAVADKTDEVKRAAVINLGFIYYKKYDDIYKNVYLLIDSYNPHVRYGCALALGIAGAASNNDKIIELLEPLMKDPSDFVKQGGAMALSMIYMETSIKENPKVETFTKQLQEIIHSKSKQILTHFGCVMALGIMNAGGRNCVIDMHSILGTFNMKSVAGLLLFTQYWYWYPLIMTLSLSFVPTTIIGVTPDLKPVTYLIIFQMQIHHYLIMYHLQNHQKKQYQQK